MKEQDKAPEQQLNEDYKRKKLINKGKHIVKAGNHPCTKLVGRLKDKTMLLAQKQKHRPMERNIELRNEHTHTLLFH